MYTFHCKQHLLKWNFVTLKIMCMKKGDIDQNPRYQWYRYGNLGSYCIGSYSPSMVDEDLIQSGLPRTFLVHCIPNGCSLSIQSLKSLFGSLHSQWSFPVTRNKHWEHNEPKRFKLQIYIFTSCQLETIGLVDQDKNVYSRGLGIHCRCLLATIM